MRRKRVCSSTRGHHGLRREAERHAAFRADGKFPDTDKFSRARKRCRGSRLATALHDIAGHDLRVSFQFVKHKGADAILLEGVGSHDEVY